jgi:hypothetical protein
MTFNNPSIPPSSLRLSVNAFSEKGTQAVAQSLGACPSLVALNISNAGGIPTLLLRDINILLAKHADALKLPICVEHKSY